MQVAPTQTESVSKPEPVVASASKPQPVTANPTVPPDQPPPTMEARATELQPKPELRELASAQNSPLETAAPAPGNSLTMTPAAEVGVEAWVERPPEPLPDNLKPSYPWRAQQRGITGTVVLRVTIDTVGEAREVAVSHSSGSLLLDRAARRAVAAWRFRPATSGGAPVLATLEVPVRFELEPRGRI